MRPSFWKGKRVLVTGHTGFKGSWLTLWLRELGAEVSGYALEPASKPSLFEAARLHDCMDSRIADIRDLAALDAAIAAARPEIIFHLAAQPLVRESYRTPVETYATNVMGTVNLLGAVRQHAGVKAVVVVTTDKVYENKEWDWGYREVDRLGGFDPYSNSKACAELVVAAFRSSFFSTSGQPAVASARAGNVIGGGDWAADRLVPDVLRAIAADAPLEIRNPGATRPWQHVLEPLHGYLRLAEKLYTEGQAWAEAWNFGPWDADTRPVGWIVDELYRKCGVAPKVRQSAGEQVHEAGKLKLDISKSVARLGWRPTLDLPAALELIAQWQARVTGGEDARDVTVAQIRNFERAWNGGSDE
jgi:CDP-glucose 4,6-dehydratase